MFCLATELSYRLNTTDVAHGFFSGTSQGEHSSSDGNNVCVTSALSRATA
jgi:hypothetical protein